MLLILSFLFGIVNTVVRGYVVKTFWGWFILSQFKNLPDLSLSGCIGLSLFASIITYSMSFTTAQRTESSDDSSKTAIFNQLVFFISCMSSLLVGSVVHSFI